MEKVDPARKYYINRFDATDRYPYGKKGMNLNDFITLCLELNIMTPFNDPQILTEDMFLNYVPVFDNLSYSPELHLAFLGK